MLANFAIALVRKWLGAGHAGSFVRSWTASQTAEGLVPSAPLQFQKIVKLRTLSKHFSRSVGRRLPYSQLSIMAAWRIVHSGLEQFEKAGAIDPEHLEVMRRVQLDVAMHLAKVEDGHAILYTEWSTRRSLRHIEQAATI